MSRLKDQYQNEIVDAMIKKFGYKNIMEVPKLDKVVKSPDRKPLSQEQRTLWLTSRSEKVCRSDAKLR